VQSLAAALRGGEPFGPERFETLSKFGQIHHKLAQTTGAPACNLGDVLTAFAAVPPAEPGRSWELNPRLSAEAFAKLGFRRASEGIVQTQRKNREGWWAHGQRNRDFIEAAATHVARPRLAVVLGAGQTFDLPLVALAERFERVVVVDVDESALAATLDSAFKDPGLRARLEPRVMDVTGINDALVRALDEVLAAAGTAAEVEAALGRLCRSYRSPEGAALLAPDERADLVVSSMLLSQVAWPQRVYAFEGFGARFGPPRGPALTRWNAPWWELELRLQQDHINALTAHADLAVLTVDVVGLPTALDAAGMERLTGRRVCPFAVERLGERIPQFMTIDRHAAWTWARYQPSRAGGEGSRMEVEGLVLREPGDGSISP
jgi:hypothetical protein